MITAVEVYFPARIEASGDVTGSKSGRSFSRSYRSAVDRSHEATGINDGQVDGVVEAHPTVFPVTREPRIAS
jgi:hypothetical protein